MYMLSPRTAWISAAALASVIVLAGCATSQEELLPTNGANMAEIWRTATGSGSAAGGQHHATNLDRARSRLRRPLTGTALTKQRSTYTRTAVNEIDSQYSRLPNPDLTLYVFPHLSGNAGAQVPIPGYTTVFPLYTRPYYAQPGEARAYQPIKTGGE